MAIPALYKDSKLRGDGIVSFLPRIIWMHTSRASARCGRSQKMPTSRFHVALWFILSLIAASSFTNNSTQRGKNISSFRSVHLRVHPLVLELTGKKTPQDSLQAKFSVFYGGAV